MHLVPYDPSSAWADGDLAKLVGQLQLGKASRGHIEGAQSYELGRTFMLHVRPFLYHLGYYWANTGLLLGYY